MPILHKYRDGQAHYIRTKIKSAIITFQLTGEGLARLQSAGVELDKPFNRWLLLDLYRSGDAYTGGTGAVDAQFRDRPVQEEIDFSNDPEPDTLFPSCSRCSSLDELHLVEVKAGEPYATILCGACRKQKVDSIDTSVPLPLVTRGILARFLEIENIKKVDSAVRSYKDLLDAEFSQMGGIVPKEALAGAFTEQRQRASRFPAVTRFLRMMEAWRKRRGSLYGEERG